MIHIATSPNLDFLFNHGNPEQPPLPLLFDSSGHFCWELNSYITKFGGGYHSYGARPSVKTVLGLADVLNVFQRFLERSEKSIFMVDDETLFDFVKYQQDASKANNNTIKRTMRRVLMLLEHTQSENPFSKLLTCDISQHDFQINATQHYHRRGSRTSVRYLSHLCIDDLRDTPTAPISFIRDAELSAWHDAIFEYTSNQFIIDRWYVLSSLLEHTGCRIEEVINIPASSIIKAYLNNDLVRDIPVLKGRYKGALRAVEIPRAELQEIYKFILASRELFPTCETHDKIFISERDGLPLERSTFNSYYRKVIESSKHVELLTGISYHNFRHRYFTILVARNISTLSKKSKVNVLEICMSIARKDSFHASNDTLSTYIHLAHDPEIQRILNTDTTATDKLTAIGKVAESPDMTPEMKLAAIKELINV